MDELKKKQYMFEKQILTHIKQTSINIKRMTNSQITLTKI
jgi:hypothetical protein